MKVYYFEFPKTGVNISGGERCMLENVQYFSSRNIHCCILTTDNGKLAYENFGLEKSEYVEYLVVNSYFLEKRLHVFLSYILRTFQALFLLRKIKPKDEDVLICNSDFFPNAIPFLFLALKNPSTKLIYWWRVMAPNIFHGFEGQFTGKYQIPRLNVIHYKLNQFLYRLTILKRGIVISPVKSYLNRLEKQFPKNKIYIIKKYSGYTGSEIIDQRKTYDLVWMGRFQRLKGFEHLVRIVSALKEKKPDIAAVILGGGSEAETKFVTNLIKRNNLQTNILLKGFVLGQEKHEFLTASRVFVNTSYFESFCQTNIEAMRCGLPVVAYDLPVFSTFEKGMVRIPLLDDVAFVREIHTLFHDSERYNRLRKEAIDFSKEYSWENTGHEIVNLFRSI